MRRFCCKTIGIALLGTALAPSCASFVAKDDYADYRAVRLAEHDADRLRAMQHYVEAHPDGAWSQEIEAERKERDADVFEQGKSSRAGLELYVDAFPDGAFIEQARARLGAIGQIEARKRAEAERAAKLAAERKEREAELRRTWVTRFFGYWIETMLSLEGWGEPIAQVAQGNREFSQAFGRPPRPRCTTEECVKYYLSNYAIPIPGGTRIERTMRLLLRLRLRDGKLERAELLMPSWGFSRWREVEERAVVVDSDPESRLAAVRWAIERIEAQLPPPDTGRAPIEGHQLAEIPVPSIGPSGELTDTTAEDPSAPPNRIQGGPQDGAAGEEAEIDPRELVAPEAPEPEADMVLEAVTVDRKGRAHKSEAAEAPTDPTGGDGEVMVMDTLAVPTEEGAGEGEGGGGGGAPASQAQPDVQVQVAEQVVEAYRIGKLRVVVFAAASNASSPAYDGIAFELAR